MTVATPQALFTLFAGDPDPALLRHVSAPTVTTFVSRGSVAEVTWLNIPSTSPVKRMPDVHSHHGPLSPIPGPSWPRQELTSKSPHSRSPSLTVSENRGSPLQTVAGFLRRRSEPVTKPPSPPARRRRTSLSSPGNLTSFPPLRRRQRTDEWLASRVDLTLETPQAPVDGRLASDEHLPGVGESPVYTRILSTAPRVDSRRSSTVRRTSRLPSGVGSSLGISSHRRRSSQSRGHITSPASSVLDSLWRRGSQLGQATGTLKSIPEGHGCVGLTSAARMRAILDRFPLARGSGKADIQAWQADVRRHVHGCASLFP